MVPLSRWCSLVAWLLTCPPAHQSACISNDVAEACFNRVLSRPQVLRDSDLPGQLDAAVRGLTAAVASSAPEPHSDGGSTRGSDDDGVRNGGLEELAFARGLDALRRGVAATLGQLLQTAGHDAFTAEGTNETVAAARRPAVVAAVLAVGSSCRASPAADAEDEEEQPPAVEAPANGDAAHAANGVSHSGDSGRLRCLQASPQSLTCVSRLCMLGSTLLITCTLLTFSQ